MVEALVREVRPEDGAPISALHQRVFGPGRFARTAYRVREDAGAASRYCRVCLIGGRIVPSFTRNWLARPPPGRLPFPFNRFDAIAIVGGVCAMTMWVFAPTGWQTAGTLTAAGLLHLVRLVRWAGERTFSDRLVLILHVAYAFVPIGFLLTGAAVLQPDHVPASAGTHAWTAGAIGMMTMAVMTRATLGHTGQKLVATPLTQAIYACLLVAAILRIAAACTGSLGLMHASGTAWILAFAGFAAVYGPKLIFRPPVWAQH